MESTTLYMLYLYFNEPSMKRSFLLSLSVHRGRNWTRLGGNSHRPGVTYQLSTTAERRTREPPPLLPRRVSQSHIQHTLTCTLSYNMYTAYMYRLFYTSIHGAYTSIIIQACSSYMLSIYDYLYVYKINYSEHMHIHCMYTCMCHSTYIVCIGLL